MRPAIGALMVLVSCSLSGTRAATPTRTKPRPTPSAITFHTDIEFTSRERQLLAQVASDLDEQSGHRVKVSLVYDLDYSKTDRPSLEEWYLTRLDSMSLARRMQNDDSLFFGVTIPRLKQTILVYDRLGADAQFRHTALHEFMHAFGTPHLPCDPSEDETLAPTWCQVHAPGRVMGARAAWDDGKDAPLCMNAADADGLARVTGQPREDFRPCQ